MLGSFFLESIFIDLRNRVVWIPWSKANELPATDDYDSAAHKELNIPDNLNNPADIQRSAPARRGVASKRRLL